MFPKYLFILRFHSNFNAFPLKHLFGVSRIFPSGLHVNKEIVFPVFFHGFPDVPGVAGVWIGVSGGQHTANLKFRVDFMGQLRSQSTGHQFVMGSLVLDLILIFPFLQNQSCAHKGGVKHHVDFIKGQPVFHLILVTGENSFAIAHETVHHLPASPGTNFRYQGHGHVKMADGN